MTAQQLMKPHDYQHSALTALEESRLAGRKKAIVWMATGLGKTVVSAFDLKHQLEEAPGRVLFLCHQKYILGQARATFESLFGKEKYTYGNFNGTEKHLHNVDFLFATFQTMANWREAFGRDEFKYVVVDEVHFAHAETFRPTVQYFQPDFMLGLTATLRRMDGLDITELFEGRPVFELELFEALARGYLCDVDYRIMTDELVNLNELDTPVGKLSLAHLNRTIFAPKRDEEIARIIAEKTADIENPRMMVFCTSIAHAEKMAALLPDSAVIHTKLKSKVKDRRLADFRSGKTRTIISVDMLNMGIDVPEANVLVFLRSTASETIFLQQFGRGLRKADGKSKVLVLDFAANCERIEMVRQMDEAVQQWRRELEPEADVSRETESSRPHEPLTLTLDGVTFDERVWKLPEMIAKIKSRGEYTREQLIEQLQRKAEELGRTPTRRDVDSDSAIASSQTFRYTFGSLNQALEAAGLKVNRRHYTKEQLIEQLKRKAEELGRTPMSNDIDADSKMASVNGFTKTFGSFNQALEAAGLRVTYTPEQLIEQLQRKAEELGRTPMSNDIEDDATTATISTFRNAFGSLTKAFEAAGLTVVYKRYTPEQLIEQLQRKAEELGRTPKQREVNKDSSMASAATFTKTFGSFNRALEAAGLEVETVSYTPEQLIEQLQRKAEELGRTPKQREVNKDSSMASPNAFANGFGSFNRALEAAGLEVETVSYTPEQLIEQLQRKAEELGRVPTNQEVSDDSSMAPPTVFIGVFGSWNASIEAAGLKAQRKRWTEEELIDQLQTKARKLGMPPKMKDVSEDASMASISVFTKRFGSFNKALTAAGLS